MAYVLSRYHVVTPPVWDENACRHVRVGFATRTASARIFDAEIWARLESRQFDRLETDILAALIAEEFLVPDDEDELASVMRANSAAIATDDTYYIVVQPTAMCQLGCDYCGQAHTKKALSEENQDRLVERIRREVAERPGLSAIFVSWFGGEPLVGLPVMRRLTPMLREIAETAGLAYEAKLVSNGLALGTDTATEVVKQMRVGQIEITLDGDEINHNARRHKKNGAPTFRRIFTNMLELARRQDLDVELSVRCNVDRRNVESVARLAELLASEGIQDRVAFYATSVYSWGNEAHRISLSPEEFARQEIEWFVDQTRLGFRPSLLPVRRPVVCMAVSPDSYLVDAYGNLFNCTEVSYVPTYGTPNRYRLGHLDGHVSTPEVDLGNFNNRVAAGELPCASCRMLPVCGGSCPKKWEENLDPCPSAKRNIEGRLLLALALERLPSSTPPALATLDA